MRHLLEGVKLAAEGFPEPGGPDDRGLSREAVLSLAQRGHVTYRILPASGLGADQRVDARRRTRLRSAKVLDAANAFLCEAVIQDRSAAGLRLLLARNVGLPAHFGVHDDETGDILTGTAAWRRGQTVGVRVLRKSPPTPLKRHDRLALSGRYYAVRG
jgi:hypothetical protein